MKKSLKKKSIPRWLRRNAGTLLDSVSMRRELDRFRTLGGKVLIERNRVVLIPHIVPENIADAFAARIKRLDISSVLEVIVRMYI